MGNKLFVRQMKRTVACVAAAATVFSMNPAGLPYAGGQAGAFVVDAATESTAVEISTYEQFAAFAKAVNAGTAESYASVKLTADITIPADIDRISKMILRDLLCFPCHLFQIWCCYR